MVVAAGSDMYSVTYSTIYSVLSGNVLDPEIVAKRKSNAQFFIMATYPDVESKRFPGWPVIAVEPATSSSTTRGFSSGPVDNDLDTSVWVYSRSARELDILSDDVRDALMSKRSDFASSGLANLAITAADNGVDIFGNDRIHWKRLDATFKVMS